MSFFQIVVTGIFVTLIMVGIGVFALFGGVGDKSEMGRVELWGTLDQSTMAAVLAELAEKDKSYQDIIYTAFDAATFNAEFIDAVAAGRGPDLVFVSQSNLGMLRDKIMGIPYSVVSQGSYISAYIDEAQLFLTPDGILAMPFSIDPLLMYWNRDLFTSAGLAVPPKYWNEFLTLAPRLSTLDATKGRPKSAVALGGWDNVAHAKAILSALFMQSGEFVTTINPETGNLISILGSQELSGGVLPAEDALRFYTDFANPSRAAYSWNRSLPNSTDAFVSGDLAVYFGFASEYKTIAERNPNLHYSVATLPQLENSSIYITYGNIQGLAIARGAINPGGAMIAAQMLSSPEASAAILNSAGLPPVRRDSLPDTSQSAALATVVQSALISRSWVDPNSNTTSNVFKVMIESVISGRLVPQQAVHEAAQSFRQLLPNQ